LVDQIEKNEMCCECSTHGVEERCIQGFGGKPEGKNPIESPRLRWEDNIKTDLQRVG
jgi:hypothetical protein